MSGSKLRSVVSMSRHRHACVTTRTVSLIGAKHLNFMLKAAPMGREVSPGWSFPEAPSGNGVSKANKGKGAALSSAASELGWSNVVYLTAEQHLDTCPFSLIPTGVRSRSLTQQQADEL